VFYYHAWYSKGFSIFINHKTLKVLCIEGIVEEDKHIIIHYNKYQIKCCLFTYKSGVNKASWSVIIHFYIKTAK